MLVSTSSRLSYHFIDETDIDFLFQLDQDPEVMKHLNGGILTPLKTIKTAFIPRLNAYRNKDKAWGLWKVTIIDTHQDIGWILFRPMGFFTDNPNADNIELGWRFIQSSWGKVMQPKQLCIKKDSANNLKTDTLVPQH